MSRNGSGTYSLPAGNPVVTGTTISSTWANNTLTDIATALTGSLAADGQTTATGNLKMGANRITGLADGLASTDAATVNQIPSGALFLLKASNLSDVANATTARGNLTAAKSGANSDITSITGLTTPLTVAQGGIGAATLTANNVLLGNGTSAPQVVAPGTSGNVLVSNGTTWVSSSLPAGSVIQVVSTALTGTFTMTGQTQTAITGLTASITPKNSANKILVMVNIGGYSQNVGQARFILTRAGTDIGIGAAGSGQLQISFGISGPTTGVLMITGGIQFLDSPATTSAITYGVTTSSNDVGGIVYINRSVSDASNTTAQRSISTITVMEIAG
jgi:hypothetical protein